MVKRLLPVLLAAGASCGPTKPVVITPEFPDAGTGYERPYTLIPLTQPSTATASMSLYFSVVDAKGRGVEGLSDGDDGGVNDFVTYEDDTIIDPAESDFHATPVVGQKVTMPTVLMLDLSGSVVASGALDSLKKAALAVVDTLLAEQKLAIISFADTTTLRADFTSDKAQLKAAIQAITGADGASTNLYGALVSGLGKWEDGFAAGGLTLTAGLGIVITDGKDTAGVSSLAEALRARGGKRLVAVGVGGEADLNYAAMRALGNAGFLNPTSYAQLDASLGELGARLQSLGRSIYFATYCSPKRAGVHTLNFTVKGNGVQATQTCVPASFTPGAGCRDANYTEVCTQDSRSSQCCTADAPFFCPGHCYRTAADAVANCGTSCTSCGGSGDPAHPVTVGGVSIRVGFVATSYLSQQCVKFHGPNCKALDACCTRVIDLQTGACLLAVSNAAGNESQCSVDLKRFCP